MMKKGDQAGIICCSNGQKTTNIEKIECLEKVLIAMGISPVFSECIYEKESIFSGNVKQRAQALMRFYEDDEIKEIFDISGGDVANGILPYLDYAIIADSTKRFWGYSDLTTVINAIYAKTGKNSVLYQVRNLLYEHKEEQISNFRNTLLDGGNDLFQINVRFVQQREMRGIVVGGNIRCFLKLAGTEYMPDLKDKVLLLESLGGTVAQIETYLRQLQQLGAFEKVSGVILGTFTQMEQEKCTPTVEMLIKDVAGKSLPIAVTRDIGHGTDSRGIAIGQEIYLSSYSSCK